MVVYQKIFKQAYEITRNNKFLWLFGLFLVVVVVFSLPDQLGIRIQMPIWLSILIALTLLILSYRFEASLIIGIKSIIDRQPITLAEAFKRSNNFYGRLIGISLLVNFSIGAIIAVMYFPISSIYNAGNINLAYALITVGVLILVPLVVTSILLNFLAPIFVVVFNLKQKDALQQSLDLITKHWPKLVVVGFFVTIPTILLGLASQPVVFFKDLPYHMIGLTGFIVANLVLLIARMLFTVFQHAVWVLVFLDLVRPQKIEEDVPVVAPEIAS